MDKFEERLRQLRLQESSSKLDESISEILTPAPAKSGIPVSWATAAVFIVGILGFISGIYWNEFSVVSSTSTQPSVQVYIIDRSGENPFDLTQSLSQFHDGEVEVKTITPKGNEI